MPGDPKGLPGFCPSVRGHQANRTVFFARLHLLDQAALLVPGTARHGTLGADRVFFDHAVPT
jgi:hypothetical protein